MLTHRGAGWVHSFGQFCFEGEGHERRPGRVVGNVLDTTERKGAEEALRENEERQTFLLKLSDALRARPDEAAIADMSLRLLAEELGADRCCIAEVDTAADSVVIPHQFVRPSVPPVPTQLRILDFPEVLKLIREQTHVLTTRPWTPT